MHPLAVAADEVTGIGECGVASRTAADDVEATVARVDQVVALLTEESVVARAAGDAIVPAETAYEIGATGSTQSVPPGATDLRTTWLPVHAPRADRADPGRLPACQREAEEVDAGEQAARLICRDF